MSNEGEEEPKYNRLGEGAVEFMERLMSQSSPPSSEQRFDALANRVKAVECIIRATSQFEQSSGLSLLLPRQTDSIPMLTNGSVFKYGDQYGSYVRAVKRGEDVVLAVLVKDNVVGFGFAELPTSSGVEILSIDVEESFRRSADHKSVVEIEAQQFEIGIGHVLVLRLMDSINFRVIHTDATNAQSRYIFKSLGFVETVDRCHLKLQK